MKLFLPLLIVLFSLPAFSAKQGFYFQLSDQTYEALGSYVAEREGSNTFSTYVGYGLTFYRSFEDSLRFNLGVQPQKAADDGIFLMIDGTFSFLYAPESWGEWTMEARFGPQFWTQQDEVQLYRALGASYEIGEILFSLPMAINVLLGQSSIDELTYTQFRAGVDVKF